MSLINDALKKAQKQRSGDAPQLNTLPGIGGEPAARIAQRGKPPGINSLLLWIGLGATALLVIVVGGFFLMRALNAGPEAPAPVKPAVIAQSTPVPVAVQPAATVPTVSTAGTASTPPATIIQAPAPVVVAETKPVVAAPAVVILAPEPETPKPVASVGKMDSKAVAYIEALRVAGIRASATDSKVLMNDRVYRTNDIVEHQLGLKLAVITAGSLTFEDEKGARYTRNF